MNASVLAASQVDADTLVTSKDGDLTLHGSSYPVTRIVVWMLHVVFVVHCTHRRRARQLSHAALIRRKQFYKWWEALFSVYHRPIAVTSTAEASATQRNSWSRLATRWSDDPLVRQLWSRSRILRVWMTNSSVAVTEVITTLRLHSWRDHQVMSRVCKILGGRSFLALWYYSHLLWSCRALEQHYSSIQQSAWSYVRVLVSIGLWVTLFEGGVVHYAQRILYRMAQPLLLSSQLSPDETMVLDPATARRICSTLRHNSIAASPTAVTTALITMLRFQFPHVAVPVVPGLGTDRWLGPNLAHGLTLTLVLLVSRNDTHSIAWRSVAMGSFVGLVWKDRLDFGATTYWGNGLLVGAVILTLVSLKARQPRALLLAWLDVACTTNGRVLVYDSQSNQWLENNESISIHMFGFDEDEDENDEVVDSSRGVHHPNAASIDYEDTELTPSTSQANQVRSRRGVTS